MWGGHDHLSLPDSRGAAGEDARRRGGEGGGWVRADWMDRARLHTARAVVEKRLHAVSLGRRRGECGGGTWGEEGKRGRM